MLKKMLVKKVCLFSSLLLLFLMLNCTGINSVNNEDDIILPKIPRMIIEYLLADWPVSEIDKDTIAVDTFYCDTTGNVIGSDFKYIQEKNINIYCDTTIQLDTLYGTHTPYNNDTVIFSRITIDKYLADSTVREFSIVIHSLKTDTFSNMYGVDLSETGLGPFSPGGNNIVLYRNVIYYLDTVFISKRTWYTIDSSTTQYAEANYSYSGLLRLDTISLKVGDRLDYDQYHYLISRLVTVYDELYNGHIKFVYYFYEYTYW